MPDFPDPGSVRIPARSRRQAMDWSLVLASQGIEPVIDCSAEDGNWGLIVPAEFHQSGLEAIGQYEAENRRWPWRRELLEPGFLFDGASLAWVLLLGLFHWLSVKTPSFRDAGMLDSLAVTHGQWWRLFTAVWLHANVAHLAANATIGLVLLGFALGRYGTGVGLLAAYLAGVGGNLCSWGCAPAPRLSLGASGMVMGGLGLLAVHSFSLWRAGHQIRKRSQPSESEAGSGGTARRWRSVFHSLRGVAAGVLLFVLLGLSPDADLLAHVGGFLAGLGLGALLSAVPNLARRHRANVLAGLLFTLLVLWPWGLALSHNR